MNFRVSHVKNASVCLIKLVQQLATLTTVKLQNIKMSRSI